MDVRAVTFILVRALVRAVTLIVPEAYANPFLNRVITISPVGLLVGGEARTVAEKVTVVLALA